MKANLFTPALSIALTRWEAKVSIAPERDAKTKSTSLRASANSSSLVTSNLIAVSRLASVIGILLGWRDANTRSLSVFFKTAGATTSRIEPLAPINNILAIIYTSFLVKKISNLNQQAWSLKKHFFAPLRTSWSNACPCPKHQFLSFHQELIQSRIHRSFPWFLPHELT